MARNFKIASEWDSATDSDKTDLKTFVTGLVGYPCKIACKISEEGTRDIYVFSEKKKEVIDWIEIQETGAVGVIYDFYDAKVSTDRLEKACDTYNANNNLAYDDGSDSDESDDGLEDGDNQDENIHTK